MYHCTILITERQVVDYKNLTTSSYHVMAETPEQLADHVRENVLLGLKHGVMRKIEAIPIGPHGVWDLSKEGK